MFELTNLDAIQIGMASPEQIRAWSHGEVTKPETINYRTLKPERDGLYCERIFGPTKDWECNCGQYKRVKYKDKEKICSRCGVQVTRAKVRRERMGHIELAAPVSHIWYYKAIPSRMGMLLELSPNVLEKVLYFASYIVLDVGNVNELKIVSGKDVNGNDKYLTVKQHELISEEAYRQIMALPRMGRDIGNFRAMIGAEAVQTMLKELNLDELSQLLRAEIAALTNKEQNRDSDSQKRNHAIKRLEVVEAFRTSGNKPEWMVLTVLPVIPPDLRPMVQLDGGRFATSDLNDLYRRVINRNNRLKRLLDLGAPDIIVRNEKRMLQESVDALIDNGRHGRPVTGPGGRTLKSLSHLLSGKQGRFRQNLLGKRVDYSGRSVIVVGPEMKLHQCGLPKEMALELFKPFVMQQLQARDNKINNVRQAKRTVEKMDPQVWDILEDVIKDHPVLLNRAPTLHRLGIQAFEPVLVDGKAIRLHPLACTAFNADFDGDQMAVHVPLSMEAQAEARFLMLAHNNILKPQDGKPVISPSQDMVIGCYYLTIENPNGKGAGKWVEKEDGTREWHGRTFRNPAEANMAYALGEISLQSPIRVRIEREFNGEKGSKIIDCTLGRLIFNDALPQNLGFKKRTCLDDMFELEIDKLCGKKQLAEIVDMCFRSQGEHKCALVLDAIKAMGYKYSTIGSLTVSVADIKTPEIKQVMLAEADEKVALINEQYQEGLLSEDQRYMRVIQVWNDCTDAMKQLLLPSMDTFNPIRMFADSGARGDPRQISQLAGMRGLMASPTGKTVELPIRANFREGLNVLEFFLSSHGSRKALSDTAMKTADSGYLTRRLVDISQEVIIREEDCFESRGIHVNGVYVTELTGDKPGNDGKKQVVESLEDRLRGRTAAEDIVDPRTGEVIVHLNEAIDHDKANAIVAAGIERAFVRSVLTCRSENGVCARCYGQNMAHGGRVDVGEAVGIIAAQAIGEPGTQLTMRTFHTGGVATGEDITQGLPRVEELFEARKPKNEAILAEIDGTVSFNSTGKGNTELIITADAETFEQRRYTYNLIRPLVGEGEVVTKGQQLYGAFTAPGTTKVTILHAPCDGTVSIEETKGRCVMTLTPDEKTLEPIVYVSSLGTLAKNIQKPADNGGKFLSVSANVNVNDVLISDMEVPGGSKTYNVKSDLKGIARIQMSGDEIIINIDGTEGVHEAKAYRLPFGSRLKVEAGDHVTAGTPLIDGAIYPQDLLRISTTKAVQDYLLREVLIVYRMQGVAVADKHIEIIVRQMLRKVRVEDRGATDLLPGSLVDRTRFEEANNKVIAEYMATHPDELEPQPPVASCKPVLLGITKAALATDSFLSAASFQETNRVLTDAAIKGKIDPLIGLKENVILGKLIPAGTGMRHYKDIEIREANTY